jgi:type I restriction enzyme S subunit
MEIEIPFFPLKEIGRIVKREIRLEPNGEYKTVGCKLYGLGVYERETKGGSDIQAKRMFLIEENDFLINRIWAQKGSAGIVPPKLEGAVVTNDFPVIELDLTRVYPPYLSWYVKTRKFWETCRKHSRGTSGRERLSPKELPNIEIPLPDIEEQKHIVAKIESMMARIEEARKLRSKGISNAETLLFTLLSHFFNYSLNDKLPIGWNWQPFKALLINDKEGLVTGPFGTLLQKSDFQSEGVPILGIANVGTNRFIPGFYDYVDQWKAESLSSYKLQSDDIVIARSGTVGRSCVIPQNIDPAPIMSTNLIRIRIDQEIFLPRLLCCLFNNSSIIERHKNSECRGSSRAFFTQKILLKLQIPVPPLPEQRRIVAYLDSLQVKVDELKRLQAETENELEELVPSILDKAFKGEL